MSLASRAVVGGARMDLLDFVLSVLAEEKVFVRIF